METKEELIDVSNYYICIYNDNEIGIFTLLTKYSKADSFYYGCYNEGEIYTSLDNNLIGIHETHEEYFTCDKWKNIGYKIKYNDTTYITNCKLINALSFKEILREMFVNNYISSFTPWLCTKDEIDYVLKYVIEHYITKDIKKVLALNVK